jgi:hypothetical protein
MLVARGENGPLPRRLTEVIHPCLQWLVKERRKVLAGFASNQQDQKAAERKERFHIRWQHLTTRISDRARKPMTDNFQSNTRTAGAPPGSLHPAGSASGPRYCAVCGEWPAMETPLGLRCHLCECRDYAAAHPVPLPENPEMLRDLASIGVPGAAEKLSGMPNGRTERCGRPCSSAIASEVARPHSLQ